MTKLVDTSIGDYPTRVWPAVAKYPILDYEKESHHANNVAAVRARVDQKGVPGRGQGALAGRLCRLRRPVQQRTYTQLWARTRDFKLPKPIRARPFLRFLEARKGPRRRKRSNRSDVGFWKP